MKTLFNLTTSPNDMERFPTRAELLALMEGFDGVELLVCEEDEKNIVPSERVFGIHMGYFPYWLDFWRGNASALMAEYGSLEACERYYGGSTREALLRRFRGDLAAAEAYGAEYVVFHVSDASIAESFAGTYAHTSAEVIDATCELLNELFDDASYRPALLLENLWQPGLTLTDPAMTRRLLDGIDYENTGFMLDTGHLFHTNEAICSQEEGLRYIHAMLDSHGALVER
ncbi:MAG: TIM barrel protein, partial [Clostridiaceae bacterium]